MFNLLVGNRDDHLRTRGFIRLPTGWRLSPAIDMVTEVEAQRQQGDNRTMGRKHTVRGGEGV